MSVHLEHMTLNDALRILADSYTDDDYTAGFVVHSVPRQDWFGRWGVGEQAAAWEVVRRHLGMQVDPAAKAAG